MPELDRKTVSVAGVGQTTFGALDSGVRELGAEAAEAALDDAGLAPGAIERAYVGSVGVAGEQQSIVGQVCLRDVGITGVSITNVENACSSSACAFQAAYRAVASGWEDIALVLGVEKMTSDDDIAQEALGGSADVDLETRRGLTMQSIYAMRANAYERTYNPENLREALTAISLKNHANACKNPDAQFQREITSEDVETSPPVAGDLRLYDFCPITDGAAAAILVAPDAVESDPQIEVSGSVHKTGKYDTERLGSMTGVAEAAETAYAQADIDSTDVDVFEVHDAATIGELMTVEALGVCELGEAPALVHAGETEIDGSHPVNPSGGLKARGHPVGATGVAQIVELVRQLRGDAGRRQVANATIGVAENAGGALNGIGANKTIHVLQHR